MNLTYAEFEKKGKAICAEKNIGKDDLTVMQTRHKFHLEMMEYVRSFYGSDPASVKQAQKLCENYEGVFWEKHMSDLK